MIIIIKMSIDHHSICSERWRRHIVKRTFVSLHFLPSLSGQYFAIVKRSVWNRIWRHEHIRCIFWELYTSLLVYRWLSSWQGMAPQLSFSSSSSCNVVSISSVCMCSRHFSHWDTSTPDYFSFFFLLHLIRSIQALRVNMR